MSHIVVATLSLLTVCFGTQVERISRPAEDGSVGTEISLSSYENPEIPEQFLVVRT